MKRMIPLAAAVVAAMACTGAWGALAPPAPPIQHQLSLLIDGQGNQTTVVNTDPNSNYYDGSTKHAYMVNEPPPNEVKHAWMKLTFSVPLGATWDPQTSDWGTIGASGAIVETGRDWLYSGSSMNFLEIWQAWDIRPNPPSEDLYLAGFFAGSNPLQLTALDIQTSCVPEPSTYVAGALLLLPLGVGMIRKLRAKRTA